MPINKKYPLTELLNVARTYSKRQKKPITFEYILFHGINDSHNHAKQLLKMLHGIRCKVNLIAYNIAYNTVSQHYRRPDEDHIDRFAEWIRPLCAPVTLRLSRGDDIRGACGQLVVQGQPSSLV
jgi:23S rRNA (adenine2503-C2)-methyltransferase